MGHPHFKQKRKTIPTDYKGLKAFVNNWITNVAINKRMSEDDAIDFSNAWAQLDELYRASMGIIHKFGGAEEIRLKLEEYDQFKNQIDEYKAICMSQRTTIKHKDEMIDMLKSMQGQAMAVAPSQEAAPPEPPAKRKRRPAEIPDGYIKIKDVSGKYTDMHNSIIYTMARSGIGPKVHVINKVKCYEIDEAKEFFKYNG